MGEFGFINDRHARSLCLLCPAVDETSTVRHSVSVPTRHLDGAEARAASISQIWSLCQLSLDPLFVSCRGYWSGPFERCTCRICKCFMDYFGSKRVSSLVCRFSQFFLSSFSQRCSHTFGSNSENIGIQVN